MLEIIDGIDSWHREVEYVNSAWPGYLCIIAAVMMVVGIILMIRPGSKEAVIWPSDTLDLKTNWAMFLIRAKKGISYGVFLIGAVLLVVGVYFASHDPKQEPVGVTYYLCVNPKLDMDEFYKAYPTAEPYEQDWYTVKLDWDESFENFGR